MLLQNNYNKKLTNQELSNTWVRFKIELKINENQWYNWEQLDKTWINNLEIKSKLKFKEKKKIER